MMVIPASFTADFASGLPREQWHNVVWVSDGSGGYRRSSDGIPADRQYRGVALADFDRDGHLDLAASEIGYHPELRPLRVYRGDGTGRWKESSEGLPEPKLGLSFSGVEFADFANAKR